MTSETPVEAFIRLFGHARSRRISIEEAREMYPDKPTGGDEPVVAREIGLPFPLPEVRNA